MRAKQPNASPLEGFAIGERVSVTWEGAHGALHVKNGTLLALGRHSFTIKSDGDVLPISFMAEKITLAKIA